MDSGSITKRHRAWICLLNCCLFACGLNAQNLPDEAVVHLSFAEISVDSALLLLSTASGINISYDPRLLPPDKRVSTAANHLKLGLVLDDVLFQTGLKYRIIGNQLIIVQDPRLKSKTVVRLSGILTDGRSGERLEYGSIYGGTINSGTVSREYGQYSMVLPAGNHTLHYSYLGYAPVVKNVRLAGDTTIDVALFTDNQLNEVFITEQVPEKFRQTEHADEGPVEMMNAIGGLMGEPDVFRMFQSRAGVLSGADGFGGLHVRGGAMDQNLILLDGVPMYNSGHALGLFSTFNPSAIKSARMIKGGFPSRYGGRLSSVLDVRTKEGNNQSMQGDVALSPLMIRGSVEGPIRQGRSSFIVSGRRTIVDPWLKPLSKYQLQQNNEEGFVNFLFYDLNAKFNIQLGNNDEVYLSAYSGKDRYDNEVMTMLDDGQGTAIHDMDISNWSWGNEVATLRWRHIFGRKLFSRAALSYSNFTFDNFDFDKSIMDPDGEAVTGYSSQLFTSSIRNTIGSLEVDYFAGKSYSLKFGGQMVDHRIRPGVQLSTTQDGLLQDREKLTPGDLKESFESPLLEGQEIRVFAENQLSPFSWLTINAGIHWALIRTDGTTYDAIQPRVNAELRFSDKTSLKLAYSEMDQYLHLLSTTGLGWPNDVWIPSTKEIAPQLSNQFSGALEVKPGSQIAFRASAYYKTFDHLRAFTEGDIIGIQADQEWESDIPEGRGEAYGFEAELEKRVGRWKGWVNYTWSKSMRTFDLINSGDLFYARNDRRHAFNINTLFQINNQFEVTAGWAMYSGNPFTVPTGIDPVPGQNGFDLVPFYGSINNIRLPTYHKLDVAVNLYTSYGWGRQKLSFGAYNAYNRNNPFYIDVVRDSFNNNRFKLQTVNILPLVPFVSIGLSFQ